ncbi:MAG: hypothetical protein MEP44_00760 [Blastomonas sp.]|nr:hypothetical protein [Blastomonas sp.]
MRGALWTTMSAALLVSGCTSHLAVTKVKHGQPAKGYPYQLRYTQFAVAVAWRVTACETGKPNPLKFKLTAEVQPSSVLDPAHFYSVDPNSLQGAFRQTEFAMEWYEDRGLKNINSSVDDQTGPAIVNVLTGVAKLAAAGLVPFGSGATTCPSAVTTALDAINGVGGADGQEAITKKAQIAVDAQTLVLSRVTARAVALGANIDGATRNDLAQAQLLLTALNSTLTLEQAKLKALVEVVSDTRTIRWPDDSSKFVSDAANPYKPSPAAQKRWSLSSTSKGADIFLGLFSTDGGAMPPPLEQDSEGNDILPKGLPYREPRAMRLLVCKSAPCPTDLATAETDDNVIRASDAPVLQAGTMFTLPFQGRTFASVKSSAGFSQNGVLLTAGSSQLRGGGTGATATFKDGAEQIGSIITGARASETARIKAKADEAKAKKELQDAEAELAGPAPASEKAAAIAAFQVDATLATAERAKIEAEAALSLSKAQQPQ